MNAAFADDTLGNGPVDSFGAARGRASRPRRKERQNDRQFPSLIAISHRRTHWRSKPIAGRFGNPLRVSITTRGEPPSFPLRGLRDLHLQPLPPLASLAPSCSARTIAGRFGNPLRVSITTRGEPPSFARRGPSREGLETL